MAKTYKKKTYKKKTIKKKKVLNKMKAGLIVLIFLTVLIGGIKIFNPGFLSWKYFELKNDVIDASQSELDVQLLTVNPYSRPGIETGKINGIVVHYTANPGASAQANRDYFENLKDTKQTKTSSNFIVGLDGEIIQCIPTWEVA